jgi:hypothetical protein
MPVVRLHVEGRWHVRLRCHACECRGAGTRLKRALAAPWPLPPDDAFAGRALVCDSAQRLLALLDRMTTSRTATKRTTQHRVEPWLVRSHDEPEELARQRVAAALDAEKDDADREPTLGAGEPSLCGILDQSRWGIGGSDDCELDLAEREDDRSRFRTECGC